MNKIIIPIICLFTLTSCGSFTVPHEQNHMISTILENNKSEISKIKNKTADDIELGYKARSLSKKQLTDEEYGIRVKEFIAKQEGHDSQVAIEIKNKTSEINNRLNSVILIIVILTLISSIVHILIDMRGRRNERMANKSDGKFGNKTFDD